MKIKFLYLILFSLLIKFSISQTSQYPKILGENNLYLIKVDNLSNKDKYMLSNFYIDTVEKKPYTGNAIVLYNESAGVIDSLEIKNGIIDGYFKNYWFDNEKQKYELHLIEYINQSLSYSISRVSPNNFSKYRNTRILFKQNNTVLSVVINYTKKKALIKSTDLISGKKNKEKMKYKTITELETWFKSKDFIFFNQCEEMNVFEEKTFQ